MSTPLPQIPVEDIFAALGKSPAGKSLKEMLRFGPFREEKVSPAYWKKILGPSSNSYTHSIYIYDFLSKRLQKELQIDNSFLTREEQKKILLAACCHDFGEAKINGEGIGDIIFIWKKKEDEEKEHIMFDQVLQTLDLDSHLKKDLHEAYNSVLKDETTRTFKFFKAVEMIEYLDTILKVYKKSVAGYKLEKSKLLIGQVLSTNIGTSIEYARSYKSIKDYLNKNAHLITGAFKYSYDYFLKYDSSDKRKVGDMKKAYSTWIVFIENDLLFLNKR